MNRPGLQLVALALALAAAFHLAAQTPTNTAAGAKPSAATPTNAPAASSTNAPAGTNAPASTDFVAVDPEVRELKVRDVLRYRIKEDPAAGADSIRVTINDSGEALFNVTRSDSAYVTVKAAGRRIADVRAELKQKLDAEFYRACTIDMSLESVALSAQPAATGPAGLALSTTPKVIVHGEIQGTFPIPEGSRLMLSDIMLQLPNPISANRKKVRVQRLGPDGKPVPEIQVDVDQLLLRFDPSRDVELKDGDRVYVPKRVIFGI